MSEKILVPALGESVTEATVSKWLKNKGDKVVSDEPLVELETDKVNIEVPSPSNGMLEKITVGEGQTVNVGSILGTIGKISASKGTVSKNERKYSPPTKKYTPKTKSAHQKLKVLTKSEKDFFLNASEHSEKYQHKKNVLTLFFVFQDIYVSSCHEILIQSFCYLFYQKFYIPFYIH